MSKGAQQAGTTTTNQGPASYMYPYIGTGLQNAGNIYSAESSNPTASVAPFNSVQQQAMGNITGMDQGLMQPGASNPYMNSMFTQAAQATQPQLASEFAGSGRNIAGSLPLRSQQLNNLANTMYGGQYQNNVQNAMNAGNQMMGVGNQIQGQTQQLINSPWTQLSQYSGALGSFQPGQATSNPYFNNPSANALGTAAGAASIYNSMYGQNGSKGAKGSSSSGGTDFGGMINNASNWGG